MNIQSSRTLKEYCIMEKGVDWMQNAEGMGEICEKILFWDSHRAFVIMNWQYLWRSALGLYEWRFGGPSHSLLNYLINSRRGKTHAWLCLGWPESGNWMAQRSRVEPRRNTLPPKKHPKKLMKWFPMIFCNTHRMDWCQANLHQRDLS